MKNLASLILCSLFFCSCNAQPQQQFQPDDVIHTHEGYELRFKHVMAYVSFEMDGEDPALFNDTEFMAGLTQECVDEFVDDPEAFLVDLELDYNGMEAGLQTNYQAAQQYQSANAQYTQQNAFQAHGQQGSDVAQWKQLLSGAALQYTYQESYSGGIAQGKPGDHLCPTGFFYIVGFSAVSGSIYGGSVMDQQGELMEQGQWDVVKQQGMVCIKLTESGVPYLVPLSVAGNKVVLQGIAATDYFPNSAQCIEPHEK